MNKEQAIESLNYWIGISECVCVLTYAIGGCSKCDLQGILDHIEKATEPEDLDLTDPETKKKARREVYEELVKRHGEPSKEDIEKVREELRGKEDIKEEVKTTPVTHGGVDRQYKTCKCNYCGDEEECTPNFDFYTKPDDPEGPLFCEICILKKKKG